VKAKVAYDEKAIQTLDPLEHIRLRTGMYIGRIGDGSNPADGIYVMLKEVIDNSVDEFIMGEGRKIEITRDGHRMTVRDYGRVAFRSARWWTASARSTLAASSTTTSSNSRSASTVSARKP
jgi:hypothetical protein